jgi:hypothetical protein
VREGQATLQYLREYRTMEPIGFDWGVAKSTVSEAVRSGAKNKFLEAPIS